MLDSMTYESGNQIFDKTLLPVVRPLVAHLSQQQVQKQTEFQVDNQGNTCLANVKHIAATSAASEHFLLFSVETLPFLSA